MKSLITAYVVVMIIASLGFFNPNESIFAQTNMGEMDGAEMNIKPAEEQQKNLNILDSKTNEKYLEILENKFSRTTSDEIIQRQGSFEGVNNYEARGTAKVLIANDKQILKLEEFVISDEHMDDDKNLSVHMIFNDLEEMELGKLVLHSDYSEHEFPYDVDLDKIKVVEIRNHDKTLVEIKLYNIGDVGEWVSVFGNQIMQTIPLTDTSSITSERLSRNNYPLDVNACNVEFSDQRRQIGYIKGDQGNHAHGRIEKAVLDNSIQIRISNFGITYDKDRYFDMVRNDNPIPQTLLPNPHIFLATDNDLNAQIDMGKLDMNRGTRVLCITTNEETINIASEYNIIKIQDEFILATAELHEPYPVLDTSPDLFADWLVLFFIQNWIYVIIALAFPLTFDYLILSGKIIATVIFRSRNRDPPHSPLYNPRISIMIPAHNEERGIEDSIRSALNIPYSNKEVIVIDDGSTDQTYRIAKKYSDTNSIKLIHRSKASGSKAIALNYGSNFATGDLILCMDGDTILERQSIQRIIDQFNDQNIVAVSGNVRVAGGDPDKDGNTVNNLLTSLQSYEYIVAMELGRRFSTLLLTTVTSIISGAFGVFRRSTFTNVGKYDIDTITEDFDLTLKMLKSRGNTGQSKVKFLDQSVAWTYCPNNMKSWIQQRERWAFGQYQTLKKHGSRKDYKNYKKRSLVAIYSMWFFDYGLNFAFVSYIIGIPIALASNLIDTHNFLNIITFVTILNLIFESIVFLFSNKLSSKKNYSLIYLVPIMALFYRPLLRFVTLKAHLKAMLGKTIKWG